MGSLVGPMGNDEGGSVGTVVDCWIEGGSVGVTVDWSEGWIVGKDD